MPSLKEEKFLWKRGYKVVVGLDEAGRGPIAGPVTAAAVTICPAKFKIKKSKIKNKIQNLKLEKVKDSKQLSQKEREKLYEGIVKCPEIKWGIGIVSEKLIDKINIKNAAELAMEKALHQLEVKVHAYRQAGSKSKVDYLIIDGNNIKNHKLKTTNHKLIVGADEKVFSCAAASILAKVTRDRIMEKLHKKYPQYGFNAHKGYPTRHHIKMLKKYGPCKIHRKSFGPVKACTND